MAHPKEVSAIAFSPDGKLLLTGAGDGKARFWETEHSRRVGPARDITGSLRTICFTPDGSRYAVASSTGDIAIWPVPRPFAKAPEILQLEAELKFGVELGADEVLRPLTPIQWRSKQNAFQTDPAR
jgi:hypothetical protein